MGDWHQDLSDKLMLLVDEAAGHGVPVADLEALRRHLDDCGTCREELQALRRMTRSLRHALNPHPEVEALVRFADGEPDGAVQAHLDRCPLCRGHVSLLREAQALEAGPAPAAESIPASLLARLTAPPVPQTPTLAPLRVSHPAAAARPPRRAWRSLGLLAAAGLALAFGLDTSLWRGPERPSPAPPAAVQPAPPYTPDRAMATATVASSPPMLAAKEETHEAVRQPQDSHPVDPGKTRQKVAVTTPAHRVVVIPPSVPPPPVQQEGAPLHAAGAAGPPAGAQAPLTHAKAPPPLVADKPDVLPVVPQVRKDVAPQADTKKAAAPAQPMLRPSPPSQAQLASARERDFKVSPSLHELKTDQASGAGPAGQQTSPATAADDGLSVGTVAAASPPGNQTANTVGSLDRPRESFGANEPRSETAAGGRAQDTLQTADAGSTPPAGAPAAPLPQAASNMARRAEPPRPSGEPQAAAAALVGQLMPSRTVHVRTSTDAAGVLRVAVVVSGFLTPLQKAQLRDALAHRLKLPVEQISVSGSE